MPTGCMKLTLCLPQQRKVAVREDFDQILDVAVEESGFLSDDIT